MSVYPPMLDTNTIPVLRYREGSPLIWGTVTCQHLSSPFCLVIRWKKILFADSVAS